MKEQRLMEDGHFRRGTCEDFMEEKNNSREEFIKKAGSEEHELSKDENGIESSWNPEGIKFKKKTEVKKGRTSRAAGSRFELKVRRDLEDKGRVVDKWTNNIDLEEEKIIIAKRKYNPFSKVMVIGTGFPDFISIKQIHKGAYSVIGVEAKMNGILSKIEKEKCAWYLQKEIFSQIWIAKAVRKGRKIEIEYDDFSEKYGEKYNKT